MNGASPERSAAAARVGREDRSAALRLVLLADVLGGGTGTSVLELSRRWDPARLAPHIVTPVPLRSGLALQAPVEVLPPLRGPTGYPVGQIRRFAQLARRMRRLQPDVLHAWFFWSILEGRLLKRLGLVPRLIENREDQGFNWGRHEYALLRLTAALPDRVVCVSEAVRQVVLAREKLDPARVVVIHNGIDSGRTARTTDAETLAALRNALGIAPDDRVVGMVANFDRPVKGVRYFVEAMPRIAAAMPSVRFVLVGRGEQAPLRARVEALGVAERVVFAGFQRDCAPFYDLMDASVLTSLSEGLSMTLLESMRHGVPVVATRVGGNGELVVDGETGYLVPPRDVEAFADRVVALLRDPGRQQAFGEAGRRLVQERFDIARSARAYEALYETVARPS